LGQVEGRLLWSLLVLLDPLHADNGLLKVPGEPGHHVDTQLAADSVAEAEAHQTRRYGLPVEDDDDGGDEGEGGADGLQTQEEPSVTHHLSILTLLESLYERLILRCELGLMAECADSGGSVQGFLYVGVEGGPVNGHQPLELAGGAKVCGLDEEEDHDEGHDSDEDVGRDEAQDEDQPNHDEQLVEDVLEVDGEGRVYFIDVPGKSVHYSSRRSRVKETHRSSEDVLEEVVVELPGGLDGAEGHHHDGEEDEEALEAAEHSVEGEVEVAPGDVRVGTAVVRPGREEDVGGNGGDLGAGLPPNPTQPA